MLIDTHCHLDLLMSQTGLSCDELLAHNPPELQAIIIPGIEPDQWATIAKLCEQHAQLYFSVGWHPWYLSGSERDVGLSGQTIQEILVHELPRWLSHPKCVAVGECGLDGMIDTPMQLQIDALVTQLRLACDFRRPVILHSLKSSQVLLKCLREHPLKAGGVLHGFSGHQQLGEEYIRQGLSLGIGGTITYARAKKTRQAVVGLPLQHLLLETDAPDMPLYSVGRPNHPRYVQQVASCLAGLRGESDELIMTATSRQAQSLFGLR